MKGKDYEHEVQRYLKRRDDVFIIRKNEGGFNSLQGSGTFFTPQKGIDFFILTQEYLPVALEVKYTESDRFTFDRLNAHQSSILLEFEKIITQDTLNKMFKSLLVGIILGILIKSLI